MNYGILTYTHIYINICIYIYIYIYMYLNIITISTRCYRKRQRRKLCLQVLWIVKRRAPEFLPQQRQVTVIDHYIEAFPCESKRFDHMIFPFTLKQIIYDTEEIYRMYIYCHINIICFILLLLGGC